ncbi:MAG: hypothetical protein WEE20_00015 [Bacteroidota bacterium]
MRSLRHVAFVLILCSTATVAQEWSPLSFTVAGGASLPTKPQAFADYWSLGFNGGAAVGYSVARAWTLVGSVDYNYFGFDEEQFLKALGYEDAGLHTSGGAASILTLSGGIKYALITREDSESPYLIGTVGFFRVTSSDITVSDDQSSVTFPGDSENAFALLFGAGVDIPSGSNINFFFEGKFGIGFTKNESTTFVSVKVGVRLRL